METLSETDAPVELRYAMPAASYGHRVWAGAAILMGGLGLVVLGGCFLIGVMLISARGFNIASTAQLNTSSIILMGVLYVLAGISFVCAALVIVAGLRGLFRVMRS